MPCEDCNVKFNLLKRKRTCSSCGQNFCGACLKKAKPLLEKVLQCHRCQVLATVPLNRSSVAELRVKDLRWYLQVNHIPTHACKEKADLVDLVMQHESLRNTTLAYPQNYERHTIRPKDRGTPNMENSPVLTHESCSREHRFPVAASDIPPTNSEIQETEDSGFTLFNLMQEVLSQFSGEEHPPEEQKEPNKSVAEHSFSPLSVNGITSLDQISNLTVMQMKLILTRNFVGFKGCCEKQELQDKVRKLWEQKQGSKDVAAISVENLCKICMEASIDCVLLDCGHLVTCTECGKRLHECPVCRQYVVRVVHTFKA